MDFGDLFWIIPLFYVLKRVFFGSRKPEAPKKPSTRELRQSESQRALSQKNREELREALGELGVALGFSESMMQEDSSQKESVETADYPAASLMPFDAEDDPGQKAGMDRGASLFPMDLPPEETAAYDHWQEISVPEAIYETDALFAEEEAFEARGNDQTREHKDESPETAAEELSPYERSKAPGEALRRLVARTSLQQAVVMKDFLTGPLRCAGDPDFLSEAEAAPLPPAGSGPVNTMQRRSAGPVFLLDQIAAVLDFILFLPALEHLAADDAPDDAGDHGEYESYPYEKNRGRHKLAESAELRHVRTALLHRPTHFQPCFLPTCRLDTQRRK